MNRFTTLYVHLDQATGSKAREAVLNEYFASASSKEATWAIYILNGGKINTGKYRVASTAELRAWVSELTRLPLWLVEDSYRQVGDLAETLALLVAPFRKKLQQDYDGEQQWTAPSESTPLNQWIEGFLLPLVAQTTETRKTAIQTAWLNFDSASCLVFNKLLTGSLRVGVSRRTVQTALAQLAGISTADMAHRMVGEWQPTPENFESLMNTALSPQDLDKPYPFFLASPMPGEVELLGYPSQWQAEWKWDGIRVQLVRRAGQDLYLWSRGEERLDGRFPELELEAARLPNGTVLDGELLAWDESSQLPRPFVALQKRIQKRKPSSRLMGEVPVRILFYDLLELESQDLRALPLAQRRTLLERLMNSMQDKAHHLALSPIIPFDDWPELRQVREQSAEQHVEGLMLKARDSAYQEGRRRGDWWKWKVDPHTIDAVLIYAQSGSGRRSTLHTDYTFAVWDQNGSLVPVAKAYSGLTDAEILKLDRWIRAHTIERFGPVRSVTPVLVFEIAFEAVNRSGRHKSGIAVRFPRIARWREDKTAVQADNLSALQALCQD